MMPLVLPEPAGGPPAIPASVATPNEHAGVAAGHSAFAVLVEADSGGAAAGSASASAAPVVAGKQMRTSGDNWLLSNLALTPATPDDGTPSFFASATDESVSVTKEEDDEESPDFPFDSSAGDIGVLFGEWPVSPQLAIRIPIPGDEEAEDDQGCAANGDGPQAQRVSARAGLSALLEAAPRDRAAIATGFAATEHSDSAVESQSQETPQSSVESVPDTPGSAAVTASPISNPRLAASGEPIPVSDGAGEVLGSRDADAAPVAGQTTSRSTRGNEQAPGARHDLRTRPTGRAAAARGPVIRSAVASAATSTDKAADAVHAVIDADRAPAIPAPVAPANSHETSGIRASSSVIPSRRIDAATSGLPFSTDRESSESGAREQEAGGRQAAAMSARLAAAVASTADAPSTHATTSSPVFAIPTIQPATPQPVMPSVEMPSGTTPTLPAENVERLVQTMHVNVKSGVMEATVRLRPEYLGEVTIQLRVDGSHVSAIVQTEAAGVRQWLESQEQAIRNGLAAHGLELDRLIVSPDGERKQSSDESEANDSRRRAFRRRQQTTQRFEITV